MTSVANYSANNLKYKQGCDRGKFGGQVASGWVGLSASTGSAQRLRGVVGFGGGVRGEKESMKDEL